MSEIEFSEADRMHPLFKRIKKHFEQTLEELRIKNDGNLSHEDTIRLRGRIQEIKNYLALEERAPFIAKDD